MTDKLDLQDAKAKPKYVLDPFKWHPKELEHASIPGSYLTDLSGAVRDIAGGVETIIELLERDDAAPECEDEPCLILNRCDAGNLARLAIRSLSLLNEEAQKSIDHAWEHHTPEGREEAAQRKAFLLANPQDQ